MKAQPLNEKKQYARMLADILWAFIEDRPNDLDRQLRELGFSDTMRKQLTEALWHED
jgi:hypothetical protein